MKKVANILGGEDAVKVIVALNKFGVATDDELLNELSGGEDAAKVIVAPNKLKEAPDDDTLEKKFIKLNDVRKAINKLYNHSIVQCERLRDEQTGWFIFRWRIQPDQFEGFIKNQKRKILRILKKRLDYELGNQFFYCGTLGDRRVTFVEAMEMIFRCPDCGKKLKQFDNKDNIKILSDKIEELEKESTE